MTRANPDENWTMSRTLIQYITSLTDLPAVGKSILVTFGKTDALIQEDERFIIFVNPEPLSDELAYWRFRIAVESAKLLARREGIEAIYLCASLVR